MTPAESRILIVAPVGADAHNLVSILAEAKLPACACPTLPVLANELGAGCSVILLTEEAFQTSNHHEFTAALQAQLPWSDIPLVMIVSGGHAAHASTAAVKLIGTNRNLTLVERPLRRTTLLTTIHAALRARKRQYEIRDLLNERDVLLASLEKRVSERTAKLEELNSELEAFSYSVSHDLRAPVRAMAMYANILGEEFEKSLSEEGALYAKRIATNAQKMDALIHDVLWFSRISRGDLPMSLLDLDQVLDEVLQQYPEIGAKSNCIEIRRPLGHVLGNAASLTQCFSNLLQNALKFVAPDRPPHVVVYSERFDGHLRISIQDNGLGIDPAYHDRIFGMFVRLTNSEISGTGVGLAIVKKAVVRMGGTVGVESSLGNGARFWIELRTSEA